MRKTDIAYFAGLFDGEGCVSITPRSNTKRQTFRLQIHITSTNEWIIQQLRFAFGGSIHFVPENSERNWKASWRWWIGDQKALKFLEIVYPYLKLKKPQVELAIQFQKHKYRIGGAGSHPDEYISLDAGFYRLMRKMNKRGVNECIN